MENIAGLTLAESYDPYGNVILSSGQAGNYGYSGEEQSVSGLVYLRARFMSPGTGTFLSRDTWDGDANLPLSYNRWMYTNGNPVNNLDPSGNSTLCGEQGTETCGAENIRPVVYPNTTNYNRKTPPVGISFTPQKAAIDHISGIPANYPFAQNFDGRNPGLCGEASVAYILTSVYKYIRLQAVVKRFVELNKTGKIWRCKKYNKDEECVKRNYNANYTGVDDMSALINLGYGAAMEASWTLSASPKELNNLMDDYRRSKGSLYIMASIYANGDNGSLTHGWPGGLYGEYSEYDTEHYVVITGISRNWDDSDDSNLTSKQRYDSDGRKPPSIWKWVRVYNPYDNGQEYYWWGDFQKSWSALDGAYMSARKVKPNE